MKILVDKMPNDVSECDWASPTDPFYDENTIWYCDWIANHHHETCPTVMGGECPFFTAHQKILNDKIIEEFNAVGEVDPLSPAELVEVIRKEYGNR